MLVVLFLISWLLRRADPNFVPSTLALIFSFVGIVLGGLTAWFGGELVDRMGVGVDQGANLDASSSLTGRPVSTDGHRRSPVSVTAEKVQEQSKN